MIENLDRPAASALPIKESRASGFPKKMIYVDAGKFSQDTAMDTVIESLISLLPLMKVAVLLQYIGRYSNTYVQQRCSRHSYAMSRQSLKYGTFISNMRVILVTVPRQ